LQKPSHWQPEERTTIIKIEMPEQPWSATQAEVASALDENRLAKVHGRQRVDEERVRIP
jgi:hypothetical protein